MPSHSSKRRRRFARPPLLPPNPHPVFGDVVYFVVAPRAAQVCLEGMIKKKYGKIVNITSQSAVIATKAHAACEHTHTYIRNDHRYGTP